MSQVSQDVHHLKEPVSDADWSRGPAGGVTLVEYVDFQCPFCQAAYPIMEEVLQSIGDRVRFVIRHFPVVSIHPQAEKAALAAEAAGKQGKFWEMHHRLFEAAGRLQEDDLLRCAQEIGLDLEQFKRDMADPAVAEKLKNQKWQGLRSGVNGTPTVYISGVRYDGQVNVRDLRAALLAKTNRG